jgi:hypothetical protein
MNTNWAAKEKSGGQIMKRAIAFALLLGVVGLCGGCSNALTESSAVGILQKHLDDQQNDEERKVGHFVVDSCDHLLLVTETVATAQCTIHVSFTKEGAAKFGNTNNQSSSIIPARFGKQPDGTWVGTGP